MKRRSRMKETDVEDEDLTNHNVDMISDEEIETELPYYKTDVEDKDLTNHDVDMISVEEIETELPYYKTDNDMMLDPLGPSLMISLQLLNYTLEADLNVGCSKVLTYWITHAFDEYPAEMNKLRRIITSLPRLQDDRPIRCKTEDVEGEQYIPVNVEAVLSVFHAVHGSVPFYSVILDPVQTLYFLSWFGPCFSIDMMNEVEKVFLKQQQLEACATTYTAAE